MKKIENLIKTIQNHIEQKSFSKEIRQQILKESNDIVEEIYQNLFTKKEILLNDLNFLNLNEYKIFDLDGNFVNDYSRDFYHFKCFLNALLYDYELKVFIENYKNSKLIDSTLLKCYEAIIRLFNCYFYFWSCERHYVHRSEIEKILTLLENYEVLLIKEFDVKFTVNKKTRYNLEDKPDEYLISFDELQIAIHMSGDIAGHIYTGLYDHTPIFEFLKSIKKELNIGLTQFIQELFWRPSKDKSDTSLFSELSHSDLLDLIVRKLRNLNLKNIHNFRDEASTDLILNEKGYKIGIQVEVNNDIKETTKKHTFTKSIKSQIQDARRIPGLDKYIILLCIDLNIKSYNTKLRITFSQLEQMNDNFFTYITPENLVEFFSD
ncbi:MAG: hypothetical protein CEE43_01725 [Promethearchaeota archaeon Loki_b32]|nr:MAG: hypothetical protein CEE43_01725 [Candidatus Lokiarchaeota archaeon Loki_b32]